MIDWTKPIETSDGRKARFVGEFNGGERTLYVVAIASYDGVCEGIGVSDAAGGVWMHTGGLASGRNVPPPPAMVTGKMYRNAGNGNVQVYCGHVPDCHWQLIARHELIEGEGM